MTGMLSGKHVWIWNWRRCDGGDAGRVAERLKAAGCAGAIVKAHDGPVWFDQGQPWREICRALKSHGLKVAGWGYLYGFDWQGEAQRAVETIQYGEADAFILDVESEFKHRADVAEAICQRIRQAVGNDFPLFYSTFAIARYHREFPYAAFERYCSGTLPLVYWNAFRWPMEQVLTWMYEDYAAMAIGSDRIRPVAGVYQEGFIQYPSPDAVTAFIRLAKNRGSPQVSFWSYEHMNDAMWQAVAGNPWPVEDMPWTGWTPPPSPADPCASLREENADLAHRIGRGMELASEMLRVLSGESQ